MRHAAVEVRSRRCAHTTRHHGDWMKAPRAVVAVAAERRATIIAMAGLRDRRLVAVTHAQDVLTSVPMISPLMTQVLAGRVLVGERCVLVGQSRMVGVRAVGVRELQQADAQSARVQRERRRDRAHQLG